MQGQHHNLTIARVEDMKLVPILENAYLLIDHYISIGFGGMDDYV